MIMQKLRALKLLKKKSVRIISVVLTILILFCVVKIILPCREYRFSAGEIFVAGEPGQTVIYEGISLPPGVYRLELEYSVDADLQAVCSVADGTVFSGGLLTNGEPLYRGLGSTGYHFWLFEKTDELQVRITNNGTGEIAAGNLKIVETNLLWSMLLALLIFFAVVLYGVIAFYYYDASYSVSAEKKKIFFFVTLIGLVASFPYLCGYNISGADLIYHLYRIEGVKDGLLSGQIPVRIDPEWLYGHGYADAVFYCSIFLHFPAVLRLLGFTVSASYNIYCMMLNFATAWISFYCFYKIFGKWWNGVICCALYTLSVYRIYKLLITSALGEGSALTFIPLVILGVYQVFADDGEETGDRRAWVPIMLGFAGLIQTHVLSCEITALTMIMFCAANIRSVFRKNNLLELAKGALSAIAVSMWFLVPFLDYYLTQDMHIKHVSARTIQDRGLYPAHLAFHFWSVGKNTPMGDNGMQYSHPVGIGLVLIVGLLLFLILWFSGRLQGQRTDAGKRRFAKKTAVIGLILLIMSLNIFPWDKIQSMNSVFAALVSSLQFPNRFLGWGTVCLIFVFGYCLQLLSDAGRPKWLLLLIITATAGITTSDLYLLDHTNARQTAYTLYNEEGMGVGYTSGGEYRPEDTDTEKITFTGPVSGDGAEVYAYEKRYLHINMKCRNLGVNDSFVEVPLLFYKGYAAVEKRSGERMELCAGTNHVVRVLLPPGFDGELELKFVPPVYWRISELISGMTVILLAVLWLRRRRKRNVR